MFGLPSRKEQKKKRENNNFQEFFRVKPIISKRLTFPPGVPCNIRLPEYDSVSRGMLTKGVATAAFGLIGFAMTSGSKQIQKEIHTRMIIIEKGVKFDRATENGGDLKIPWEEIVNVNVYWHAADCGLIFVFKDNSTLNTSFFGNRRFTNKNVLTRIADYINSRASGTVDDGWNVPASFTPLDEKHVESKPSEMDPNSCSNCGSPIEAEANFCSECGQKI